MNLVGRLFSFGFGAARRNRRAVLFYPTKKGICSGALFCLLLRRYQLVQPKFKPNSMDIFNLNPLVLTKVLSQP